MNIDGRPAGTTSRPGGLAVVALRPVAALARLGAKGDRKLAQVTIYTLDHPLLDGVGTFTFDRPDVNRERLRSSRPFVVEVDHLAIHPLPVEE